MLKRLIKATTILAMLLLVTACTLEQTVGIAQEKTPQNNAIAGSDTASITTQEPVKPTSTLEPTPEPTPAPTTALDEQSGILGTWTYYGSYDPMKWGWEIDQSQSMPDEKIDKTDDAFTITLLENALDDGGEETYSLKYSLDGKTAVVDTDMYWQFVLLDDNQLLEINGDAIFIYVR